MTFDHKIEARFRALLDALIDQRAARVLVAPQRSEAGFWFGGGNVTADPDGRWWLVGRYRNAGDSRTGLAAGERGLELALFVSEDCGTSFTKVHAWSKSDLSVGGRKILSIEGAALHRTASGDWKLFVSTEKAGEYPESVAAFQKPGTGIWSIDVFTGAGPDRLDTASLASVFASAPPPEYLHVKDPVVYDTAEGDTVLVFCNHPFCWTSSNSGYAVRPRGVEAFDLKTYELGARGPAWVVAGFRMTCRIPVPRVGVFADLPPMSVYFYDGLECVRPLDENPLGVRHPRGYSCEELSGACYGFDSEFPRMTRLSRLHPLFVSPYGTGCSRYVDVLPSDDALFACWQQGQDDGSQPLVGHRLEMDDVRRILE
ncbi:MAG: Exo-alpha-sialidase [Candidatus Hydrogenedentes bacterium]|nr:Exo-alpha-sialidase [Candidatus Hydrogenedentota bacterium]